MDSALNVTSRVPSETQLQTSVLTLQSTGQFAGVHANRTSVDRFTYQQSSSGTDANADDLTAKGLVHEAAGPVRLVTSGTLSNVSSELENSTSGLCNSTEGSPQKSKYSLLTCLTSSVNELFAMPMVSFNGII